MTILEHIKQLAPNLTPEEKDALAQYLAESNGEKPQSLRGDWSDAFSDGSDVEAELKEIRGEWQKEWRDEFVG